MKTKSIEFCLIPINSMFRDSHNRVYVKTDDGYYADYPATSTSRDYPKDPFEMVTPCDLAWIEANAAKKKAANARKNAVRKERDSLMRDCGMVKVKGSVSGRTYWE